MTGLKTEQIAARAAAIADADVVLAMPEPGEPARCLLCRREAPLAVVVALKTAAVGLTESELRPLIGVCVQCRDASSETTQHSVAALAQSATRACEVLSLVRHGAERQLVEWWGGVGACTANDVDQVCVDVRRAIERMGGRS